MEEKQNIIGLKKAKSHLEKVIQMIEDKKYCIDIVQQNLAVIGLLRSVNNRLMEQHLNSCFVNAMKGTNDERKQKMINEILAINKIIK